MASVIYDEKSQRMAEEMVMAEAQQLAQREAQECDCKDGMFPRSPASRRKFLFAAGSAASLAGSTAALAQKAPPGAVYYDVPADPTKELGRAVAADGGYGSRSQFETEVRTRFPTANEYTSWSFTPLDKMVGNLTASGPALRTSSRRHPDHRSGQSLAGRPRHGRYAEEILDGGPQTISFGHPQALH